MSASNRICIKDNKVINIIFADDDFVTLLNQTRQFDVILDQNNLQQAADIGFIYDGKSISPPPVEQLDPQLVYQIKIQKAILGFNNIMVQYAASNVLAGITQAGKTQLIADALKDVQRYGQSGSLYAAISALQSVQLTADMDPYLNSKVIANLISQAQTVLASL